jgi:glycine/D-amino acid oxidase-like deaminating enzyme
LFGQLPGKNKLKAGSRLIAPVLASAKILAWQACYRPVTRDGLPLIGPVPEVAGAYVATGHSVWGILNAPANGEAMAELIVDGAAHTADLNPFNPGRMPPFDPASLRVND